MRFARTAAVISGALVSCSGGESDKMWPTQGWIVASPAGHGMDESALSALDAEFASGKHGYIDGMLVVREGRIVYEKSYARDYDTPFKAVRQPPGIYNYYDPEWHPYYKRGGLHTMQSVTKSVTSAAIGIAVGRGELPGVDVKILPYFSELRIANLDDRKRAITLRDLLTMTAGFEWDEDSTPYTDPGNPAAQMEASEDWIQFAIDRPMAHEPGRVFAYSSGVSQLLARIMWKATGRPVDEYAAEHLFKPLGIAEYYWKRTPLGVPDTEGGLYLTARDLAKIGHLYLNDGEWEGRKVLPAGWVRESLTPSSAPPGGGETGFRYGYQWWLIPRDGSAGGFAFAALGYGGQRLLILPELDLVAVFTGWNVYETPALDPQFALERVVRAVKE
jgi:CubicO group peptidase (beta-lactamase class C family)